MQTPDALSQYYSQFPKSKCTEVISP